MSEQQLVLDNSVISAFAAGGWFNDISFWTPRHRLYTTDRIWTREFSPHHSASKPAWLQIEAVDTSELATQTVQLGEADWTLIRLAETLDNPILVSNDKRLLEEVDRRGIKRIWGSKFLKQTFESCGISTEAYASGLQSYIDDVPIPPGVVEELRDAEKK